MKDLQYLVLVLFVFFFFYCKYLVLLTSALIVMNMYPFKNPYLP